MQIVLGVTGGIAAYKSAYVLRQLTESGHDVTVVPTPSALRMVGAATWEALSHHPVSTDVFEHVDTVNHVRLGAEADLVIVAPATAHTIAKIAHGMADNLLTATVLTATCPVVIVPAMHTQMWLNPATQANVAVLRERGVHVMEPAVGRLTGSDTGAGRLPEPEDIVAFALDTAGEQGVGSAAEPHTPADLANPANFERDLLRPQDLEGAQVVISAGGTREAIDPVRFIGNRSSGRQGVALAVAAADRGASVTLIAANVASHVVAPALAAGVHVVDVESSAELEETVTRAADRADVVIMNAAVSDFRPSTENDNKIKKADEQGDFHLTLVPTTDILAGLVQSRREGQVIVGFAAETGDDVGDELFHAARKARRKGADLLAVNSVRDGKGFGTADNSVHILDANGDVIASASGSKADVAHAVLDATIERLHLG